MAKKILMCPPDYFDVVYSINPWMDPKIPVLDDLSKKQWNNLVEIYKSLGFEMEFINPQEGLPDMVFAANGFFALEGKAILAHFRYPQRKDESNYFKAWLQKKGFEVFNEKSVVYEGEGDTLLAGNYIFQGWGFRSYPEIVELMQQTFPNKKVIPLHLLDDRFYHMDTCFFPISEDLVFLYEKAFDQKSIKLLKNNVKNVIGVSDKEALTFCLNSVINGETIITNSYSKNFVDCLKAFGFKVITAETSEYIKSGGSVKCLTNEIW